MANVPESSTWEAGVYQFETTDLIQGGPGGTDNIPHQQLGNRTKWLYDNKLSRDGSQNMTGGLQIQAPAGDALALVTPNGVDAVIRISKTSQTGATIKAINGAIMTIGVDNGAGNTERMRIDSAGRFGVATTALPQAGLNIGTNHGSLVSIGNAGWPQQQVLTSYYDAGTNTDRVQLRVPSATANNTQLELWRDGTARFINNSAETLRITSDGKVGIGSTSPQEKLGVLGHMHLSTGPGFTSPPQYQWRASDNSLRGYISLDTETAGAASDEQRFYQQYGFKTFYTQNAERMRIHSGGNVNIGGTADIAKLVVKRDANATTVSDSASIVLSNRNTQIAGGIMGGIFADTYRDVSDPHYSAGMWFTRGQEASNLASSSSIVFGAMSINSASSLPAERMRITPDGNVGVGTISPQARISAGTGTGKKVLAYDGGPGQAQLGLGADMFGGSINQLALFTGSGSLSGNNIAFGFVNTTTGATTEWMRIADGLVNHGTPSTGATGNESVTAAWVRAQGYITSGGAPVQSVAGKTGAVTLNTNDVGEASNLYFTNARAQAAALAQFTQSHATNGYVKLPNGTLFQWGQATPPSSSYQDWVVSFPISFPNACLNFQISDICPSSNGGFENANHVKGFNASNATVRQDWIGDNVNGDVRATSMYWFAIGY